MLIISKKDVTGNLGPNNRPAAFCKSGDTVLFETRDCYDDRLMANGTLLDPENTLSNPATGPLYIEEACPGDVLKVEILKISLNPTGIMQALPGAGTFGDLLTEECVRQFFLLRMGMVPFNETLPVLHLQPMIGVIGNFSRVKLHFHTYSWRSRRQYGLYKNFRRHYPVPAGFCAGSAALHGGSSCCYGGWRGSHLRNGGCRCSHSQSHCTA